METVSTYSALYNRIVNITCTPAEVDSVKLLFIEEINSKRRYHSIGTLRELLRVLEKRGCLNPENLVPLKNIASLLRPSVLNLPYSSPPITNNIMERPVEIPVIQVPREPQARAYRLIASDIGKKWQDFARAVGLREGQIDNLSHDYRNVSDRVYQILRFHEENCDTRCWLSSLLHALREARRSDLSNRVQNIFDTS